LEVKYLFIIIFIIDQGGGLADDNLYALDLRRGEDQAGWL